MRRRIAALFTLFLSAIAVFGQINPCDLNADGSNDAADVSSALSALINPTNSLYCASQAQSITGTCNSAMYQRVVIAAFPGGGCLIGTGTLHNTVQLSWTPSTSPTVSTYNLYPSSTSGGEALGSPLYATPLPATVVCSGTSCSCVDTTQVGPVSVYYEATATDTSDNVSGFSNEVMAAIPAPVSGSAAAAITPTSALRGTTAQMPLSITSSTENVGTMRFSVTVPTWASKATVTATSGKPVACTMKTAPTIDTLMCAMADSTLNAIPTGATIATVNVPIPSTMTGSANIGLVSGDASSIPGDVMTLATAGGKLTILTSQAQQEANRHEGKPKLPVPPGGVVPKRKGEGLLQRWSCDPDPDSDGTLRCVLTLHLTDAIVATPEFFTLLTSSSDPSVLEPPGDVRFNPAAKEVVLYFKAKPSLDPSPEIVHVPVVVGVSMKEGDSLATTVWVPLIR